MVAYYVNFYFSAYWLEEHLLVFLSAFQSWKIFLRPGTRSCQQHKHLTFQEGRNVSAQGVEAPWTPGFVLPAIEMFWTDHVQQLSADITTLGLRVLVVQ